LAAAPIEARTHASGAGVQAHIPPGPHDVNGQRDDAQAQTLPAARRSDL
jgi:hypothetical protein